ncbi:endopeptidase Rz [Pectobacterium phage Jarilo]|uniref:Endopeptidase Rz n=1 Tax=Pectobacterium phage Jarilo TaxID=2163634 RepID=A0A2S1GT06_9CAUD|nr:Rz-like spanin [Pectobacterium phage Jarilo]AWD92525.1 endopeptidase Rz [Pectobacterium phage Jarilo]
MSFNLKTLFPFIMAALIYGAGYFSGYTTTDNKWKEVVHNEYVLKQEATAAVQRQVDDVSKRYQQTLSEVEGSTDRIISDLNADNKRLRVKVKSTGDLTGDRRCFPDGKAELDESTAKRLIGITQRGDAQIEVLQETIRKLKGGDPHG